MDTKTEALNFLNENKLFLLAYVTSFREDANIRFKLKPDEKNSVNQIVNEVGKMAGYEVNLTGFMSLFSQHSWVIFDENRFAQNLLQEQPELSEFIIKLKNSEKFSNFVAEWNRNNKTIISETSKHFETLKNLYGETWKQLNTIVSTVVQISNAARLAQQSGKEGITDALQNEISKMRDIPQEKDAQRIIESVGIISQTVKGIKEMIIRSSSNMEIASGDFQEHNKKITDQLNQVQLNFAKLKIVASLSVIDKQFDDLSMNSGKQKETVDTDSNEPKKDIGHSSKISSLIKETKEIFNGVKENSGDLIEAKRKIEEIDKNIENLINEERIPKGYIKILQELLLILVSIADVISFSATTHLISNEDIRIESSEEKRAMELKESFSKFKTAFKEAYPDPDEDAEKEENSTNQKLN